MKAESHEGSEAYPLSRTFAVENIPDQGLRGILEASKQECTDVANFLDLPAIGSIVLEYDIERAGLDRFRVSGRLLADVTQSCVVTLEPVDGRIDERLELEFWPPEDVWRLEHRAEQEGFAVPIDGPEPVLDGIFDIGHLAYEHLATALDPYPRKPGAHFEWHDPHVTENDESSGKPFAELENLLRRVDDDPARN